MSESGFRRKPWRVDWFEPEVELTKTAKPCRSPEDYSEDVTLYFGDLHTHTNLSPCANLQAFFTSIEQSYEHARHTAQTDFVAITDHAEKLTSEQWAHSMELARTFNDPGRFIAWPAVEWANGLHGHRNIYYRGYDAPLLTGQTHPTPRRLWAALRELDTPAFTIPHHAAKELIADLTVTDDELEPAFEIFSVWGNSEYYGAPWQDTDRCFTRNFAVDTLMRGFRMGFVGGGDGHAAPPAESGITGIYARDLTLDALFEAVLQRRTFATTGAKIRVDFSVNGFPMGSVIRFNQHDVADLFPLEIGVGVQGTANLEKVEIVENGVTVYTKTKPRRLDQMGFVWRQGAMPANARFNVPNNVSRFIYVRVTQRDGHMAWTSPIWLDFSYDE